MEVYSAKGSGMYPLAFFVISAILLNAYCCAAVATAVLVKTNSTDFRCDSRLHECLVEDDLDLELELDFLINPYVSRILGSDHEGSLTTNSNDPNNPVCRTNGPQSYDKACISQSSSQNNGCDIRSSYSRCHPP